MWNNHCCQPPLWRRFLFRVLTVLAISLNLNYVGAQQTPSGRNDLLTDEHFAPGQVLATGRNTKPVGPLKAKTYRLERVKLAKPFETLEADGTKHRLETAFRLTVTLDSPPNGDYFIWIDDVPWRAYPSGYKNRPEKIRYRCCY